MRRWGCVAAAIAVAVWLGGCDSASDGVEGAEDVRGGDLAVPGVDVPEGADVLGGADVPAGRDTPAGADVPAGLDVPEGADVPARLDTPVPVDAPTGLDQVAPDEDATLPPHDAGVVTGTRIFLQGGAIAVEGPGAVVDGTVVTVQRAGTYLVSGTLHDGQVRVDTLDTDPVELVLQGVDVTCATSAALYVVEAEYVSVVLAEGTDNALTDGATYVLADPAVNEPNAALFSMADLEIKGSGHLKVDGNYNDGIACKDSLHVEDGTLVVTAEDDGLRGKDEVVIEGGHITVTAGGDGLTSDNADDAEKGFVLVEDGTLVVTSGGDGLAAETTVTVSGGSVTVTSGGGSRQSVSGTASAKGLKGVVGVSVTGGTIDIDAADDGIHSNTAVVIDGGTIAIASADDGVHADETLDVLDGVLDVTRSYEGLESAVITIDGGTLHIVASDDGINVAGGADGSGGWPGDPGGDTSSYFLYIHGGYVAVNANGDGLDSNGSIEMTGGVVLVNGPTERMNGPLDIGEGSSYMKMTGGFLVASGSSGMAIAPDTVSTQYSVLVNFTTHQAGQIFHLRSSAGTELLTFAPSKAYQSVAFSSPELARGTYDVYFGGSSTGTLADSLYDGGTYTPGTKFTTFTVSSITTRVGSGGGPGW